MAVTDVICENCREPEDTHITVIVKDAKSKLDIELTFCAVSVYKEYTRG